MSAVLSELEHELAHEFEHEAEAPAAHEIAHEQEAEHEAFFNNLSAMADRTGRSQALRKIALAAARAALKTQPTSSSIIEGESEFEFLAESEFEVARTARTPAQIDAMLEHLGHTAAEAANEQEAAEHFLPLIPLAAKMILPVAAKALGKVAMNVAPKLIKQVTPTLTRAVSNITRQVFQSPTARPLLHAMPKIARSTVAQLAKRAAHGKPIDPRIAIRTLARNTYRTLSNPRTLVNTYHRSLRADGRHHRRIGRYVGVTPANRVYRPGYVYPGYRGPRYRYNGTGGYTTTGASPAPSAPTNGAPAHGYQRRYYSGASPTPVRWAKPPRGAVLTNVTYTYSLPRR